MAADSLVLHQNNPEKELETVEYSWNDYPILVPISMDPVEWNAIYIGFFMAECTGAKVHLTHVTSHANTELRTREFLEEIEEFAHGLGVGYEYRVIDLNRGSVGVSEISEAIVSRSKEISAQAIIMAANRETFFRELFGRISDRVVISSRCKVVLVETPWRGMRIPNAPKKILIPILREEPRADLFIVASALTSSASTPDVELIVVRVVPMPPTIPLDAVEVADILRKEEQEFSLTVSDYIRATGRFFSPRMVAVRHVGEDVASFAKDNKADLILLQGDRGSGGYRSFMKSEKYEIVSKSPCVVLVVYS